MFTAQDHNKMQAIVARTIYFNLKSQIQLFLISKLVAHNHFQVLKRAGTREMLSKSLKMLC